MAETIFSFVIFLVSLVYLLQAKDLRFGTLTSPGVGFLPMIAGTGAAILSLIVFLSGLRKRVQGKDSPVEWKKLGLFLAGLILYVPALETIGYALSTFALMLYLLKVSGAKGWVVPVLVGAGVSFGIYYGFTSLLGVPLP